MLVNHSTVWQVRPAASLLTLESMPHQRLVNLGPTQNSQSQIRSKNYQQPRRTPQKERKKKSTGWDCVDHEFQQSKSNRQRLHHWILFWHFGFWSNAGWRSIRTMGSCWPWAESNPWPHDALKSIFTSLRPSWRIHSFQAKMLLQLTGQCFCFSITSGPPSTNICLCSHYIPGNLWLQALQGLNSFLGPGPSDYATYLFKLGQLGWSLQERVKFIKLLQPFRYTLGAPLPSNNNIHV